MRELREEEGGGKYGCIISGHEVVRSHKGKVNCKSGG